jgi:hypothetical protein
MVRPMGLIRSLLLAIALLCFLVLALVANPGVWALSTLTDSEAFAATTTRIISEPAVRTLLADRLAVRLTDLVAPAGSSVPTVVRVGLRLPRGATRDDVRTALTQSIDTVLGDPGMVTVQQSALEGLHRMVLDVIAGDPGSADSGIVLDLDAVILAIDQRLDADGPGFLGRVVPAGLGTLTVVPQDQLTVLVRVMQLLEALRWLLPTLCVAAALLVLLLARARLHAIAWLGLCLVLVGAVGMLAATGAPLIAGRLFGSHPDTLASTAATLDGLTATLMTQSAVLAGLGLAMLVVGITAGMVTGRADDPYPTDRYA